MANGFFEELSALGSETNVDTDLLVEKVKSAMLKAARKVYPNSEENLLWHPRKRRGCFPAHGRKVLCAPSQTAFGTG